MKVIVPVAGIGNRLKPHTLTQPKPLLHVAGRPMLAFILEPIVKLDPEEVIFVVGYRGTQIRDYVEKHYSFKATFVEQDKLLGLGYAIHLALEDVESSPLLIVLGDTIVECDLEKFVAAGDNVLGLRQVYDPKRFGIAEVADNKVVGLEEKPDNPKTNLAVIGLYSFANSDELKKNLSTIVEADKRTSGEIQLTDALAAMLTEGTKFEAYEVENWYDCGKKETLLATNQHLLRHAPAPKEKNGVKINPPVYLAPTAKITNSEIGPYVSVSDKAEITDSRVENSIIGYEAKVENAELKDSLVGRNALVQGGKVTVNIGEASEVITC